MEQKTLSTWLKLLSAGVAAAAAVFYAFLLPAWTSDVIDPERLPYWLTLLLLTAVPNYLALWQFWRVSGEIGRDNSFSMENAVSFRRISRILAAEALLLFAGILLSVLLHMGHPNLCVILFLVTLALLAVSVLSAVLSHLVRKAWQMKQENDLTI